MFGPDRGVRVSVLVLVLVPSLRSLKAEQRGRGTHGGPEWNQSRTRTVKKNPEPKLELIKGRNKNRTRTRTRTGNKDSSSQRVHARLSVTRSSSSDLRLCFWTGSLWFCHRPSGPEPELFRSLKNPGESRTRTTRTIRTIRTIMKTTTTWN